MELLEVLEYNSREAAKFSLDGLKEGRARAYALLLLLMGGGSGLGALGLAMWFTRPLLAVAAFAGAVWWFTGAAWLAARALKSESVRSWAPANLLGHHENWVKYQNDLVQEGELAKADDVDPVRELRLASIRAADNARDEYRDASVRAFLAVDQTYRAMVITPFVCAMAVSLWGLVQRFG
jgi:hypothetical protein